MIIYVQFGWCLTMAIGSDSIAETTRQSKFPYGRKIARLVLNRVDQQQWRDVREDYLDVYEMVLQRSSIGFEKNSRELRKMVRNTGRRAKHTDPHKSVNSKYEKFNRTVKFITGIVIVLAAFLLLLGSAFWVGILSMLEIFDQTRMRALSNPLFLLLIAYILVLRLDTDFSRELAGELVIMNCKTGISNKQRLGACYIWNNSLRRSVYLLLIPSSLVLKRAFPEGYEFVKTMLIKHAGTIPDPNYGFFRTAGLLLKYERIRPRESE